MRVNDRELHVTCSAGISLYPQDGADVETLLKNADAAMYRAKAQGRNNFQFYTSEMNRLVNERLTLEHDLRRALQKGELVLHYQPRINLESGAVDGVEALVRWMHPERGLILPDNFIPIAEETGLIVQLGEWVLQRACEQSRAWKAARLPRVAMAVNLSARQFREENLVRRVAKIVRETGLKPGELEMELTESMIMHDAELAIATLRELKALGVRLSVDDFGTGYSSLSYLQRLPIGTLKIDKSFVQAIGGGDPDAGVLARAIISLGHSLHLKVVAEGVETEAQLAFLKQHRCDEAQGFYFARPMPPEECAGFLERRQAEKIR
jgi:EAL domain-containing protein (putative c-di-GMP-specific phosphodiesterase class I)